MFRDCMYIADLPLVLATMCYAVCRSTLRQSPRYVDSDLQFFSPASRSATHFSLSIPILKNLLTSYRYLPLHYLTVLVYCSCLCGATSKIQSDNMPCNAIHPYTGKKMLALSSASCQPPLLHARGPADMCILMTGIHFVKIVF